MFLGTSGSPRRGHVGRSWAQEAPTAAHGGPEASRSGPGAAQGAQEPPGELQGQLWAQKGPQEVPRGAPQEAASGPTLAQHLANLGAHPRQATHRGSNHENEQTMISAALPLTTRSRLLEESMPRIFQGLGGSKLAQSWPMLTLSQA